MKNLLQRNIFAYLLLFHICFSCSEKYPEIDYETPVAPKQEAILHFVNHSSFEIDTWLSMDIADTSYHDEIDDIDWVSTDIKFRDGDSIIKKIIWYGDTTIQFSVASSQKRQIISGHEYLVEFISSEIAMITEVGGFDAHIDWQTCLKGNDYTYTNDVLSCQDGGYLICGFTNSTDLCNDTYSGYYDGFAIKLNSEGTEQWSKYFGGTDYEEVYSAIQTHDGGYAIIGYTESQELDTAIQSDDRNYLVVKLDASGNEEWIETFGGSEYDYGRSIFQTNDNGYIIAGETNSKDRDVSDTTNNGEKGWIIKLSSSGQMEWNKTYNTAPWQYVTSVIQTADNGYLFISEDDDYGQDAEIYKISSNGDLEWNNSFGGSGNDGVRQIINTSDGGSIFIGSTNSRDGDISEKVGDPSEWGENKDVWVVKLDASGAISWNKCYGGDRDDFGRNIIEDSDGNYYLLCETSSFNKQVTNNFGNEDCWIVKIDNTGELLWQNNYGSTYSDYPASFSLTTDNAPIVLVSSSFNNGNIDIDCISETASWESFSWIFKLEDLSEF